jgi:hypothetical protein
MTNLTRRRFVVLASAAGLGALAHEPVFGADSTNGSARPSTPPPPVADGFPIQPAELVREMVGVSHANLPRVQELLELHPSLANAAWDWGFGDWETALGAASHTGHAEIARALLARGARPSLFSAAMLGQLAVVRAFVEASPGVQATAGPHGITLLAHARAGGEAAKPVLDYLTAIGGADLAPASVPLSAEQAAQYSGLFAFGSADDERIEIDFDRGALRFTRPDRARLFLVHLGEHAFHPRGATAVRVRFTTTEGIVSALSVHDPGPVLIAQRVRSSTPLD